MAVTASGSAGFRCFLFRAAQHAAQHGGDAEGQRGHCHCRRSHRFLLHVGIQGERERPSGRYLSNGNSRFQSSFMLITTQPRFFASSYSAWVKVPTLVSGRPWAGP